MCQLFLKLPGRSWSSRDCVKPRSTRHRLVPVSDGTDQTPQTTCLPVLEVTWSTRPCSVGAAGSGASRGGCVPALASPRAWQRSPQPTHLQPGSCTAHHCLLGRWVKAQLIQLPAGFGLEHFPWIQPGRCVFPTSILTSALGVAALSLCVLQQAEGGAW